MASVKRGATFAFGTGTGFAIPGSVHAAAIALAFQFGCGSGIALMYSDEGANASGVGKDEAVVAHEARNA